MKITKPFYFFILVAGLVAFLFPPFEIKCLEDSSPKIYSTTYEYHFLFDDFRTGCSSQIEVGRLFVELIIILIVGFLLNFIVISKRKRHKQQKEKTGVTANSPEITSEKSPRNKKFFLGFKKMAVIAVGLSAITAITLCTDFFGLKKDSIAEEEKHYLYDGKLYSESNIRAKYGSDAELLIEEGTFDLAYQYDGGVVGESVLRNKYGDKFEEALKKFDIVIYSEENFKDQLAMEEPAFRLWKKLNNKGFYDKPYNEFLLQYGTPEGQKLLYHRLRAKEYYTKSEDAFVAQFFEKKISYNVVVYEYDSLFYTLEVGEVDSFLREFPSAVRVKTFKVFSNLYSIPIDKVQDFKDDFPFVVEILPLDRVRLIYDYFAEGSTKLDEEGYEEFNKKLKDDRKLKAIFDHLAVDGTILKEKGFEAFNEWLNDYFPSRGVDDLITDYLVRYRPQECTQKKVKEIKAYYKNDYQEMVKDLFAKYNAGQYSEERANKILFQYQLLDEQSGTARLRKLYETLKLNPSIKGLPEKFIVFEAALADTAKRREFYERAKENENISWWPKEYEIFNTFLFNNEEQTHPLYRFMLENELTTKDENNFIEQYSDPEKAKELYSFFIENNLTTKSFEEFYDFYFN